MLKSKTLSLLSAVTLVLAGPAFAGPSATLVNIRAEALPDALQDLARQTGADLLYDRSLVTGVRAAPLRANLTTEAALRLLLKGSNVTLRRAASGAWVLEPAAAPPLAKPDVAVAEILVVGGRTQNTDIRRFETDVQPYRVVTQQDILDAHRDTIEDYFMSRVTTNAAVPVDISRSFGSSNSAIDIRGLGSGDTLVLVDGRRMPSLPQPGGDFIQSDLNGIPLHAIKRVEILTGSAGGIYGFGALGGVVNVVLDRDTRGLDLHATGGITSRGDARRSVLDASFGRTSADGATDVSIHAARSQSAPLLAGQRDYTARDRMAEAELLPRTYVATYPHGNSVGVFSVNGSNLQFTPAYGGANLSSSYSYLPAGFSGDAAALAASLAQRAGQLDFSLGDGEANTDLTPSSRTDSLFVDLRHRFGSGLEAYADAVALRSRGRYHDRLGQAQRRLAVGAPGNPFVSAIVLSYPVPGADSDYADELDSTRYTVGLMSPLPFNWRGTVESSLGGLRSAAFSSNSYPVGEDGLTGNPLSDWTAFQQALGAPGVRYSGGLAYHNRFRDESLRLAGPVFSMPGGPATLTLLAEHRSENTAAGSAFVTNAYNGTTSGFEYPLNAQTATTTSLYGKLRTLVFGEQARWPLLRRLEVQLAARRDVAKDDVPTLVGDRIHPKFTALAYTAGAKVSPTSWLTLRGSYATGAEPPPLSALSNAQQLILDVPIAVDPRRGGTGLGQAGAYTLKLNGNPDLKAVRATTLSFGVLVTPLGQDGPRFTVDYSRIRRTGDVVTLTYAEILDHESLWPQRVVRGQLTDADRALGYTAGPVTLLDVTNMNRGSLEVGAIDAHGDWPVSFLGGRLRLYGDATYHMHTRQKTPFHPTVEQAGYEDGALKWRANGGVDWSRDRLTIGVNVQYFGSSLVTLPSQPAATNAALIQYQGSSHIPAQAYVDLHASWRLPLRDTAAFGDPTVDLGVVNLFDHAPPRVTTYFDLGSGYSQYGDPRQRRFEFVLNSHF